MLHLLLYLTQIGFPALFFLRWFLFLMIYSYSALMDRELIALRLENTKIRDRFGRHLSNGRLVFSSMILSLDYFPPPLILSHPYLCGFVLYSLISKQILFPEAEAHRLNGQKPLPPPPKKSPKGHILLFYHQYDLLYSDHYCKIPKGSLNWYFS
jgi:hypothetical protein